jgi:hypothetical protein
MQSINQMHPELSIYEKYFLRRQLGVINQFIQDPEQLKASIK